jgi:dTDP-4-amino-4,6-dideoxygalactose transaminase
VSTAGVIAAIVIHNRARHVVGVGHTLALEREHEMTWEHSPERLRDPYGLVTNRLAPSLQSSPEQRTLLNLDVSFVDCRGPCWRPIPIHRPETDEALAERQNAAPHAAMLAEGILSLPMFPSLTGEQNERNDNAFRECAIYTGNSAMNAR